MQNEHSDLNYSAVIDETTSHLTKLKKTQQVIGYARGAATWQTRRLYMSICKANRTPVIDMTREELIATHSITIDDVKEVPDAC